MKTSSKFKTSHFFAAVIVAALVFNFRTFQIYSTKQAEESSFAIENLKQTVSNLMLQKAELEAERDVLRSKINATGQPQEEHDTKWCPTAKCHDSSLCEPCSRRFLIILASGRSGSTTLVQMINALPNVRMAGENNGALKRMKETIEGVTEYPAFKGGAHKLNAWFHNKIPQGSMACAAQRFIEAINPPPEENSGYDLGEAGTIIGFKTIRFLEDSDNITEDFEADDLSLVNFMKQHFPCTRYLVNVRSNITAQVASMEKLSWGRRTEKSQEDYNNRLKRLVDHFGPEEAYLLDSSLWLHNVSLLNDAVEWLGFRNCTYDKILEFNTKGRGYINGETEMTLPPTCHYQK